MQQPYIIASQLLDGMSIINRALLVTISIMGVGCVNPVEVKFEALYNEEVNFLSNQGCGYRANYPREGEKDKYISPHKRQKQKDSKGG
ncbi:hypothetical protein MTR67_048349 [Solanum verrucosum]|uniref:Uncharacterized protein n=1 Tax=Solanum verrucosum TaxID=315347 RepID=A0AAF0ZZY4_SOLVR|nr:hypothetical protein MTR67_048349 [Solanum verrucosum]